MKSRFLIKVFRLSLLVFVFLVNSLFAAQTRIKVTLSGIDAKADTTIYLGDSITFYAKGYDQSGNFLGYISIDWSIVEYTGTLKGNSGDGVFGTSWTFTPTDIGSGRIIFGDIDTTGTITVDVGELCYIKIHNDSPDYLFEQRGDTLIFPILIRPPRFRTHGFDCDSNEIGFISATWQAIEGYDYRITSCGRLVASVGEFSDTSCVICVVDEPTNIQSEELIPSQFKLETNIPNPFNSRTQISFQLPKPTQATITIYDIDGRKVKELVSNRTFSPGRHSVVWDGTDKNGGVVGTGIYLCELRSKLGRAVRKMLLVK